MHDNDNVLRLYTPEEVAQNPDLDIKALGIATPGAADYIASISRPYRLFPRGIDDLPW